MVVTLFAASTEQYYWATDLGLWSAVVFVLLCLILAVAGGKPLMEAMSRRQLKIVEELNQASIATAEAERAMARHEEEKARLQAEAKALIAHAKKDAERIKAEIVARAEAEVKSSQERVDKEIRLFRQKAMQELWFSTAEMATSKAEELVRTQLSADDHRRLIDESWTEIFAAAERRADERAHA